MALRQRPLAVLLAAALAALGAGCGDDEDDRGTVNVEGGTDTSGRTGTSTEGAHTTPSGPASMTIRVNETEFELDPQNPRIARTGIVAFRVRNTGGVTHALEVEGPHGEQETDPIDPGGSATLKVDLDKAGRYTWYCPIGDHEDRGMKGLITVGGGGASRGGDDRGGERRRTDDDGRTQTGGGSGRGGGRDDDRDGVSGGAGGY